MGFKNLKFSLDTKRIKKTEPIVTPDYKPWNILSPDYLEDAFPLHVGSAALIFFTHIGATNEKKDDGCGCGSCHVPNEQSLEDKETEKQEKYRLKHMNPRSKEFKEAMLLKLKAIAKSNGGKCNATEYIDGDTKVEVECWRGHKWMVTQRGLVHGRHWCKECSKIDRMKIHRDENLKEIKKIVGEKGGKCRSVEYLGGHVKLEFECKRNHVFPMAPNRIKNRNDWCGKCVTIERQERMQKRLQEIIEVKGGKLLSNYIRGDKKVLIECADKHQWKVQPNSIFNSDSWCPHCTTNVSEGICRTIIEFLIGMKCQINYNILGDRLQLDGYCDELKLAFEYQGEQHYRHVKYFHKTANIFHEQQQRDAKKRVRCKEMEINLIVIPYTEFTECTDNMAVAKFIYGELIAHNIPVVKRVDEIKFDAFKICKSNLDKVRKIVEGKGGKLFTDVYMGAAVKMLLECDRGHAFPMSATAIYQDYWCPICDDENRRFTMDDMHALAHAFEGYFLSTDTHSKFTPSALIYLWKCKRGHVFEKNPRDARRSWCSECNDLERRMKGFGKMHEIAISRAGYFLALEYIDNKTKYPWRCKRGHIFYANGNGVSDNCWCPDCAKIEVTLRQNKKNEERRKMQQVIYASEIQVCLLSPPTKRGISGVLQPLKEIVIKMRKDGLSNDNISVLTGINVNSVREITKIYAMR